VRAIVVDVARFVVCATVSGVARIWRWGHRGIFGCQTMHNFVYLAQRRSREFSCEPNFGGRDPCPPWLRQWPLCVCLLGTLVSLAKADEPIEMRVDS